MLNDTISYYIYIYPTCNLANVEPQCDRARNCGDHNRGPATERSTDVQDRPMSFFFFLTVEHMAWENKKTALLFI